MRRPLRVNAAITVATLAGLLGATAQLTAEELNPDKEIPAATATESLSLTLAPLTYHPDLVNTGFGVGEGIPGSTDFGNISNSASWEYYRFCASPGATVTIETHRTTSAMDPAQMICQGTTTDSTGIFAFSQCGPQMGPFVDFADDNNGIPHGVGGFFADPKSVFVAPAGPTPNEFTLMVFDFIGQGPNPQFEIHASGISACLIVISIDIKPGSFPNSIDLSSGGATPVAMLGSATFDVTLIDLTTLALGSSSVKTVGKRDPRSLCNIEDVSGDFSGGAEGAPDGFADLVCHFVTESIVPEAGDTEVKLSGNLFDGTPFEGSDSVNIVP